MVGSQNKSETYAGLMPFCFPVRRPHETNRQTKKLIA